MQNLYQGMLYNMIDDDVFLIAQQTLDLFPIRYGKQWSEVHQMQL